MKMNNNLTEHDFNEGTCHGISASVFMAMSFTAA